MTNSTMLRSADSESSPPEAGDGQITSIRKLWRRAVATRWPISVAFALLILLVWQWYAASLSTKPYIVPPTEIVQALTNNWSRLVDASVSSVGRVAAGWAVGAAAGIVIGLVAGVLRPARDLLEPIISLTYPMPKIALFPAFAVILGYTDLSRIAVIALVAFYPAYLNAYSGSKSVDRRLLDVARNAGVSRSRMILTIVLPAAVPRIFVGLRISLAVSFVLLYVAEALGGMGQGLGFTIMFISQADRYPELYAAIMCFAVLGVLGDRLLLAMGRRITRGQELEVVGDAQ